MAADFPYHQGICSRHPPSLRPAISGSGMTAMFEEPVYLKLPGEGRSLDPSVEAQPLPDSFFISQDPYLPDPYYPNPYHMLP